MSTKTVRKPRRPGLKLRVKRSSAGLGLFSEEDRKRGDFILEYFGPILSDKEADDVGGSYMFALDPDVNIDGSGRDNTARYINHSCRPNCEVEIDGKRLFIYAKRKIKIGEEITYDYGDEFFKEMTKSSPCKCEPCA